MVHRFRKQRLIVFQRLSKRNIYARKERCMGEGMVFVGGIIYVGLERHRIIWLFGVYKNRTELKFLIVLIIIPWMSYIYI